MFIWMASPSAAKLFPDRFDSFQPVIPSILYHRECRVSWLWRRCGTGGRRFLVVPVTSSDLELCSSLCDNLLRLLHVHDLHAGSIGHTRRDVGRRLNL